jgi:hypothetical protein
MGTGYFSRVNRPGRGVDHPPPSGAEVKETVKLYLTLLPLCAFVACSRVNVTFTYTIHVDIDIKDNLLNVHSALVRFLKENVCKME